MDCDPTTSVRLLTRARGGDRAALDSLFARQLPRLLRWARGRLPRWARDVADTADLVQESVLSVFRHIDRFDARREGALQAYLRACVLNRIRDECRRAGRRPPRDELDEGQAESAQASPLEAAIGEQAGVRYASALQRLRPEEQEAVVARVELGYSYAQIALVLRKPSPDAARVAVSRALVRLAREMDAAG